MIHCSYKRHCKYFTLIFVIILITIISKPLLAEENAIYFDENIGIKGEVIDEPICFKVINSAPYSVVGSIITDHYTTIEGDKAKHRSNFRLKTGEITEFCTSGPFFEGRRLELTLKTLIPIFSCKTAVTSDIIIYGERKKETGTKTWAECI